MKKIKVKMRSSGRVVSTSVQYADILVRIKKAEYVTEDRENEVKNTEQTEINASAHARKLADESGVDLSQVNGTGVDGAVTKADVQAYLFGLN